MRWTSRQTNYAILRAGVAAAALAPPDIDPLADAAMQAYPQSILAQSVPGKGSPAPTGTPAGIAAVKNDGKRCVFVLHVPRILLPYTVSSCSPPSSAFLLSYQRLLSTSSPPVLFVSHQPPPYSALASCLHFCLVLTHSIQCNPAHRPQKCEQQQGQTHQTKSKGHRGSCGSCIGRVRILARLVSRPIVHLCLLRAVPLRYIIPVLHIPYLYSSSLLVKLNSCDSNPVSSPGRRHWSLLPCGYSGTFYRLRHGVFRALHAYPRLRPSFGRDPSA